MRYPYEHLKKAREEECGGKGSLLRGTLGICGVGHFLCGVAVKKIPACGVAVISSLTVCDVCILKSTVYGEKKLSAVFPFP